ncbi:flavodoxin domain-containing protein [Enterococcus sp. LJL120]
MRAKEKAIEATKYFYNKEKKMKTLIVYGSKYGCTEDCAQTLKDQVKGASTLVNLKTNQAVDLEQFDQIIIGSPIYVGKIRKEVKHFCEVHLASLLKKKVSLFICCTTPAEVDAFFASNYPPELLAHATKTYNFGGELRQERMGFLDKKLTALIAKTEPKETGLLPGNLTELATFLNASQV